MKTNLVCLAVGIIVGFFFCYRSCKDKLCPEDKTIETITYKKDTTAQHPKLVGMPITKYIDTGSYHTFGIPVLQKVDTSAIIAQYLKAYIDTRHYRNDTADITVNSIVAHDSILKQEATFKYLQPVQITDNTTVTTTQTEHRKLFIGVQANVGKPTTLSFIPSIEYENLKGVALVAGIDPINKNVVAGAFYKIQLRK